jgi:predicted DNA-binding protein
MRRATKNSKPPRQKTVSFRLPDDLMEQIRLLARSNRRTLSGEVQLAIEKHLESNGHANLHKSKTDP